MATMTFNETEQACIHQLAEWYPRQGIAPCYFTVESLATAISVSVEEARALAMTMETLGLVDKVT